MNLIQALILGVVEGVTEFLPISSTGHLILVSTVLKIAQNDFVKTFEIFIQLGAILAVVVIYWRRFLQNWAVLSRVIVAFIPTGIIGLLLYKILKTYLLGNDVVVLISLFIGGIIIIIFEVIYKEKIEAAERLEDISYSKAFWIGVFQSIAIIPGVSRSAATILGGLALKIKRITIVEFSFLLAVPTILAASGLDLLKNFREIHGNNLGLLAVGFIGSFVVAIISIRFLLNFIKRHNFIYFGVYRIIISIIFFLVIFL